MFALFFSTYSLPVIHYKFNYIHFSITQICVIPEEHTYDLDDEQKAPVSVVASSKNSLSKPLQIFKISENGDLKVQSLSFYGNVLIVGTNGGTIIGFTWLKKRLTGKKSWEIQIPPGQLSSDQCDINSMWLNKKDGVLYAGCGDNNVYSFDLNNGQIIHSFTGHTDYIHWIDGTVDNILYSASEDGSVRIWDRRSKHLTNRVEPFKEERIERQCYGKWQGSVSAADEWFVCGGGPKLALYHLRSMETSMVFDFNSPVHVSGFLDDIIYVGGDTNRLLQYNMKGDVTAEIPTASSSIYSVISQTTPEKLSSIAGSSNYLDICTNFNYKDITIKLYQSPKDINCLN